MNRVHDAAVKAGKILAAVVAGVVGLYASTRVTVRMPLAVPVALIAVVLGVIAFAFRQPRGPLVPKPELEPATPVEAEPPSTWSFDDETPAEGNW